MKELMSKGANAPFCHIERRSERGVFLLPLVGDNGVQHAVMVGKVNMKRTEIQYTERREKKMYPKQHRRRIRSPTKALTFLKLKNQKTRNGTKGVC